MVSWIMVSWDVLSAASSAVFAFTFVSKAVIVSMHLLHDQNVSGRDMAVISLFFSLEQLWHRHVLHTQQAIRSGFCLWSAVHVCLHPSQCQSSPFWPMASLATELSPLFLAIFSQNFAPIDDIPLYSRIIDYMDEEIFGSIFKGLVRPHLEYAAPVWNPKAIYQIDKIENVQRRATKLVPGLANLSYLERLKILKLHTLAYRRTRGDMIQVFKMINPNYGYDKSIPCLLTPNDNKYHKLRGHSKKLFPYSSNKDIRKFCFSNRIVHIWNSLPENVVSAENILSFEKNLDHHWRNQELLYDNHKAEIKLNTKTHPNEDGQSKSHNPMSEPAQCDLAALLQLETWKRNHKIP